MLRAGTLRYDDEFSSLSVMEVDQLQGAFSLQHAGTAGHFGMTVFAGAVEAAISRVMNRLRFLFTAEVMGIIVALIGIVIIPVAIKNFFGLSSTDTVTTTPELIVAVITLATMIGINVWVKGNLESGAFLITVHGGPGS